MFNWDDEGTEGVSRPESEADIQARQDARQAAEKAARQARFDGLRASIRELCAVDVPAHIAEGERLQEVRKSLTLQEIARGGGTPAADAYFEALWAHKSLQKGIDRVNHDASFVVIVNDKVKIVMGDDPYIDFPEKLLQTLFSASELDELFE